MSVLFCDDLPAAPIAFEHVVDCDIPTRNPPKPMAGSMRRRLPSEVREAIAYRYATGESAKALNQEFDISRDGLRRLLKRAVVAIRTQFQVTPEVAQHIVQLYERGMTIRQVAAQVGCAYGTVRGVLHEIGAEVRVSPVGRRAVPHEES